MKTIALLGATGKTGSILLRKLIAKGYQVRVLVRNPANLKTNNNLLTIIRGDAYEEQSVFKLLDQSDAVINVIGHVKGCPPNLQTVVTRHVLNGMKKFGIKRLINLTGAGVELQGDKPGTVDKSVVFIMKHLAGKAMKYRLIDGDNHVKLILRSNVEWTIVRAPVLLKGKAKGNTKIGLVGHIPGFSLTFEDLTNEMIKMLETNSYIQKYPYLTNG